VGAGLILSGLTLYLAVKNVAIREVSGVVSRAEVVFILLALASTVGTHLLKVVRWRFLIGPPGEKVASSKILTSYLAGQMLNILFPARVGEISRVYVVGELGPGKAYIIGTIVVEKVLDTVSYALLIIWTLLLYPLPDWIGGSGWTFAFLTLALTLGFTWMILRREVLVGWLESLMGRLPQAIRVFGVDQIHKGFASLEVLKSWKNLLILAGLTALAWGSATLTNYLTLSSIGIHLPMQASVVVLIVLQAGISLPSSPGKIGLFEYACVIALALFQVDQAHAFSFGLLLHGLVFLPVILAGLAAFWWLGLGGKSLTQTQINESPERDFG
jgi:uncharacterized protein (TIRG00374 family)